jgi:hypothetical protein
MEADGVVIRTGKPMISFLLLRDLANPRTVGLMEILVRRKKYAINDLSKVKIPMAR